MTTTLETVSVDVPFGRGGNRDLLCDIYRPAPARSKHTAVIQLHGGGFVVESANPALAAGAGDDVRRSFSPIEHVKAGFPPTMLLHGAADLTVSVDASLELYAALRAAKTPVELHVIEGVTHIFDSHPDLAEASAQWIDLFLDRHVVNPRVYASTEPPRR